MIGTGIVAGAFMDMIGTGIAHAGKNSIIRKRAVWLEVIGWIFVGCWTFYILYLVRDGAWRIYDPVAQISGMLLYVTIFYKQFRFFGRILLVLLIRPLLFLVRMIVSIISLVIRFIVKVFAVLFTPFVKIFRIISGKLFKRRVK